MRLRLAFLQLTAIAALTACVPPPAPAPLPAPVPAPAPTPTPTPTLAPPPPFAGNWMDAPLSPGDWSYAAGAARFSDATNGVQLMLHCDRAAGGIDIFRVGTGPLHMPMVIRAETAERSLVAEPAETDPAMVVARVSAFDPLLDAMAFSKGRFAVELAGLPTLYIPSYPEVTRVIEDCR